MRIAVMGISGCGKTTLSKALAAHCSLPLLEERLRTVIKASMRVNNNLRNKDQEELSEALHLYHEEIVKWLKERNEFHKSHNAFVSDRCCFDALGAWMELTRTMPAIKEQNLKSMISFCQQESASFDIIVVLPVTDFSIQSSVNEDGLKRTSGLAPKLRQQSMILGLLQQFSRAPIIRVPSSQITTDQRVEYVLKAHNALVSRRNKRTHCDDKGSILG